MKQRILAIIPARGGSKGVPRKNIKNLAGKPLIAWTIEEAKKSKFITRLILSTEDEEIIKVAKQFDCEVPFIRPLDLAQDGTPGIDPVLHAIEQCPGYDYVILLQPTSPLRTVEDIDGCIEIAIEHHTKFCVSVTEPEYSPFWTYTIENGYLNPLIKQDKITPIRQDLPKTFKLNGAVYVAKVSAILQEKSFINSDTKAYIMPTNRSMDIDTELDFEICESILRKRLES